jgi:methionine-rich copper-binding protein CopC
MRRITLRLSRLAASTIAALALIAVPTVVAAHADLESSTPEAGADLDTAPTEVVLTFSGELDPASTFVVTDADGTTVGEGELDLDVAERNVLSGTVDISEPGVYTVAWTAVSVDGHPEEGSFEFGFQADAAQPTPGDDHHDGGAESPDTAMPSPTGPNPAVLVGLLLVVGAAGLTVRRVLADEVA